MGKDTLGSSGGVIFLCNDTTYTEVLSRGLFGATSSQYNMYRKALSAAPPASRPPIFLRNHESKLLVGPFRAKGGLAKNIAPDAWGGQFPTQIRFHLDPKCAAVS